MSTSATCASSPFPLDGAVPVLVAAAGHQRAHDVGQRVRAETPAHEGQRPVVAGLRGFLGGVTLLVLVKLGGLGDPGVLVTGAKIMVSKISGGPYGLKLWFRPSQTVDTIHPRTQCCATIR